MPPTLLPPLDLSIRCEQYTERSPGLHQSRILHHVLQSYDPERFGQKEGTPAYANFMMGLIFERALEMAWVSREFQVRPELIRPGEIIRDGIIVTPDGYDTHHGRPEEYKFTKMSCRQPITDKKFWHYWVQLKAQAWVTGSNEGVLWLCHVNGNWSKDFKNDPEAGYVIRGYVDQWTNLELEENWVNVYIRNALRMGWLWKREDGEFEATELGMAA